MNIPGSPLALPEATSGRFAVKHQSYPPGHKFNIVSFRQAILTGTPQKDISFDHEVTVHALKEDGRSGQLMSDVPVELRQMREFAKGARGKVLIGGLGLGLVARLVAARKNVETVTVVEIEPDIINLVRDGMPAKVRVVQADLFKYLRSPRLTWGFDTAFFDTWYATSEMTWVDAVAPLRRIVRNRFGARRLRCWAEDEMLGQMVRALAYQSARPLEKMLWSPAHYAFRAATIWKYPAAEEVCRPNGPTVDDLRGMSEREQLFLTDAYFHDTAVTFLKQVGGRRWEKLFGQYWDAQVEHESKQRRLA